MKGEFLLEHLVNSVRTLYSAIVIRRGLLRKTASIMQGRSFFSTAGMAGLFRGLIKNENAVWGQKMRFSDRLLMSKTGRIMSG